MRFFLFFLLETALVLAITNDPVLVCRKDKCNNVTLNINNLNISADSCTCVVVQYIFLVSTLFTHKISEKLKLISL